MVCGGEKVEFEVGELWPNLVWRRWMVHGTMSIILIILLHFMGASPTPPQLMITREIEWSKTFGRFHQYSTRDGHMWCGGFLFTMRNFHVGHLTNLVQMFRGSS